MQAVQTNGPLTLRNGQGVEPPPTKLQSLGKLAGKTVAVVLFLKAKDNYVPRDSIDSVMLEIILWAGFFFIGLQWIQYRSEKIQRKAYSKLENAFSEEGSIPALSTMNWMKTPQRQYTHTHEFAIEKGFVLSRCHTKNERWKRLYFPGMAEGVSPKEIRADGANLMIYGSDRRVYYKKMITEDVVQEQYQWNDLSAQYNWIDTWFTLPVICEVGRFLYTIPGAPSGLLSIPEGVKSWSISHLGRYAGYYEDGAGNRHNVTTVTQVLTIFEGSNDVYWADPHVPGGFNYPKNITGIGIDHRLPGPDCEGFVSEHIDSSGSMIVMSGKVDDVWRAFTCFTDFDIRGLNPTHLVTKDIRVAERDKVRLAMPVVWKPVTPLPDGSKWSGPVQVMQTGPGNDRRFLTLNGTSPQGITGYFGKEVKDREWNFVPSPTPS